MGMFDSLRCIGPQFVCSRGHSLADEEFQTKDFDCELAWHLIENDTLTFYGAEAVRESEVSKHGIFERHEHAPHLGNIFVYTSCHQCPCYVYGEVGTVVACWCEFKVRLVDNKVEAVERTAEDYDEFARRQAELPDLAGPIPLAEAIEISSQRMRAWAARRRA